MRSFKWEYSLAPKDTATHLSVRRLLAGVAIQRGPLKIDGDTMKELTDLEVAQEVVLSIRGAKHVSLEVLADAICDAKHFLGSESLPMRRIATSGGKRTAADWMLEQLLADADEHDRTFTKKFMKLVCEHPLDGDATATEEQKFAWRLAAFRGLAGGYYLSGDSSRAFLRAAGAAVLHCIDPSDRFQDRDGHLRNLCRLFDEQRCLTLCTSTSVDQLEDDGNDVVTQLIEKGHAALEPATISQLVKFRRAQAAPSVEHDPTPAHLTLLKLAISNVLRFTESRECHGFEIIADEMRSAQKIIPLLEEHLKAPCRWLTTCFFVDIENIMHTHADDESIRKSIRLYREALRNLIATGELIDTRKRKHSSLAVEQSLQKEYERLDIAKVPARKFPLSLTDDRMRNCPGWSLLTPAEQAFLENKKAKLSADELHTAFFQRVMESSGETSSEEESPSKHLAETMALDFAVAMRKLDDTCSDTEYKLYIQSMILMGMKSAPDLGNRLCVLQNAVEWIATALASVDFKPWQIDIFPSFIPHIRPTALNISQWNIILPWWNAHSSGTHWRARMNKPNEGVYTTLEIFNTWLDSGARQWIGSSLDRLKRKIKQMVDAEFSGLTDEEFKRIGLIPALVGRDLAFCIAELFRANISTLKRERAFYEVVRQVLVSCRSLTERSEDTPLSTESALEALTLTHTSPRAEFHLLDETEYVFLTGGEPSEADECIWQMRLRVPGAYLKWLRQSFAIANTSDIVATNKSMLRNVAAATCARLALRTSPGNLPDVTQELLNGLLTKSQAAELSSKLRELKRTELLEWAVASRAEWQKEKAEWDDLLSEPAEMCLPMGDLKEAVTRLDRKGFLERKYTLKEIREQVSDDMMYLDEERRRTVLLLRLMRTHGNGRSTMQQHLTQGGWRYDTLCAADLLLALEKRLNSPKCKAALSVDYRAFLYYVYLEMVVAADHHDCEAWLMEWLGKKLLKQNWIADPMSFSSTPYSLPSHTFLRHKFQSFQKSRGKVVAQTEASISSQECLLLLQAMEKPHAYTGPLSTWLSISEMLSLSDEDMAERVANDMKVDINAQSAAFHCCLRALLTSRQSVTVSKDEEISMPAFHWLERCLLSGMTPKLQQEIVTLMASIARNTTELCGVNVELDVFRAGQILAWLVGLKSITDDASQCEQYVRATRDALKMTGVTSDPHRGGFLGKLDPQMRASRLASRTWHRLLSGQSFNIPPPRCHGGGNTNRTELPRAMRNALSDLALFPSCVTSLISERASYAPRLLRDVPKTSIAFEYFRSGGGGSNPALAETRWYADLMQCLAETKKKVAALPPRRQEHGKWLWNALFFDAEDLLAHGKAGSELERLKSRYVAAFNFALEDRGFLNPRTHTHSCPAIQDFLENELKRIHKSIKVETFEPFMLCSFSDARIEAYGQQVLSATEREALLTEEAGVRNFSSYAAMLANFLTQHLVSANPYSPGTPRQEKRIGYNAALFLSELDSHVTNTDYKFYVLAVLIQALRADEDAFARLATLNKSTRWLWKNFVDGRKREEYWKHDLASHLILEPKEGMRESFFKRHHQVDLPSPTAEASTKEEAPTLDVPTTTLVEPVSTDVVRESKAKKKKRPSSGIKVAHRGSGSPAVSVGRQGASSNFGNMLNVYVVDAAYADEAYVFLEILLAALEKANTEDEEDLVAKQHFVITLCEAYRQQGRITECFADWLRGRADFVAWRKALPEKERTLLLKTFMRQNEWKKANLLPLITSLQAEHSTSEAPSQRLAALERVSQSFGRQLTLGGRPKYALEELASLQQSVQKMCTELWPRSASLVAFLERTFERLRSDVEDEQNRTLLALEAILRQAVISLPLNVKPSCTPSEIIEEKDKVATQWYVLTGDPTPWIKLRLRATHSRMGLSAPDFPQVDWAAECGNGGLAPPASRASKCDTKKSSR